ncbi:AAA family ATPase [Sulfurifustis variabilis]|nr:AAA family ATPase [Sulfurifustis variabilis]
MTTPSGNSATEFEFMSGLVQNVWDFTDMTLKTRFAQALERGVARYPIFRSVRIAARRDLEALFDDLAVNLGWRATRLDTGNVILDAEGLFVSARGFRKADYASCQFAIWAKDVESAARARDALLARIGDAIITEPMFSIDWHFLTAKNELENADIEEMADDVLHDAAYPELETSLPDFIHRYLASPETVLVLQGPPGTGKTRLIRAILAEISRRKAGNAHVLYTADKRTTENDEIFVKFITGWHDVFVVEDADHLLRPRAEGNENLHRFLTIADGVVRAQGRKIIFSTNLPNIGDLDDALIRPGRCFARVHTRGLVAEEAQRLLESLSGGSRDRAAAAWSRLRASADRTYSLAEIYKTLEAR